MIQRIITIAAIFIVLLLSGNYMVNGQLSDLKTVYSEEFHFIAYFPDEPKKYVLEERFAEAKLLLVV